MRLYAGTSGFSYKAWKGHFYPEDLPAARMLEYYAEHLPAVEINSTFYRMPRESVLADWASRVPESFSFVLKASRRITHMKRLKDAGDEVAYLYGVAKKLGAHRGPLLFQTPPNLKKDLDRLRSFLAVLPDEHQAAFEFRHSSWFEDDVFEALREAGAALCAADTGGENDAPLVATGPFGYLRLRRDDYGETDLASWAQSAGAESWESVFVFFKHEDAGVGPRLAARFTELFEGVKPRAARSVPPAQGSAA